MAEGRPIDHAGCRSEEDNCCNNRGATDCYSSRAVDPRLWFVIVSGEGNALCGDGVNAKDQRNQASDEFHEVLRDHYATPNVIWT